MRTGVVGARKECPVVKVVPGWLGEVKGEGAVVEEEKWRMVGARRECAVVESVPASVLEGECEVVVEYM